MSQLQGTLLVDLTQKMNPATMEIEEIGEVPQCNYIAQVGAILEKPSDSEGISYRKGGMETYYYQFGKDWDLGLLNVLAMPIYAKKLGFGSWLNYIDLYGVPWMFVITNRMDAERRDELYNMMDDMRAGRYGVLHGNESVEFGKEVSVAQDLLREVLCKRVLHVFAQQERVCFGVRAGVVAGDRLRKRAYRFVFGCVPQQDHGIGQGFHCHGSRCCFSPLYCVSAAKSNVRARFCRVLRKNRADHALLNDSIFRFGRL